jgi:hypothetical protein
LVFGFSENFTKSRKEKQSGRRIKTNINTKIGDIEMKKRWKDILAIGCLIVFASLWYEAIASLNEIIALYP